MVCNDTARITISSAPCNLIAVLALVMCLKMSLIFGNLITSRFIKFLSYCPSAQFFDLFKCFFKLNKKTCSIWNVCPPKFKKMVLTVDNESKKIIAAVQYGGIIEKNSFPITLKTVRIAIVGQVPNIYKQLCERHIKLKAIYAHCKKRDYSPKVALQLPKVGRNDPCPCGSGKKHKKCCLQKTN